MLKKILRDLCGPRLYINLYITLEYIIEYYYLDKSRLPLPTIKLAVPKAESTFNFAEEVYTNLCSRSAWMEVCLVSAGASTTDSKRSSGARKLRRKGYI